MPRFLESFLGDKRNSAYEAALKSSEGTAGAGQMCVKGEFLQNLSPCCCFSERILIRSYNLHMATSFKYYFFSGPGGTCL